MNTSENKMIFTDWYTVLFDFHDKKEEIPVPIFLKELDNRLVSNAYNVFYNEKSESFSITYDGIEYDVILNNKEKDCLSKKEYSPLLLKLLSLASMEKKYNDEKMLQTVQKMKINEIIDSNYEDLKSLEDYKLYLEYLKQLLTKTKREDKKIIINTKIVNIIKIIKSMEEENKSLNLQVHIKHFIYSILDQIENLDISERITIANELKNIVVDYKKIFDANNQKK